MATSGGKDALAALVEAEYLRRGGEHFRPVVAIGDGAARIRGKAGALNPHATPNTGTDHAREHLRDLASHLAFITPDPAQWLQDRLAEPGAGNIEAIITAARQYPLEGVKATELATKLGYFEHNAHRMRYAHFKKPGMFTGSGRPSDRPGNSDPAATATSKIISNNADAHPSRCAAASPLGLLGGCPRARRLGLWVERPGWAGWSPRQAPAGSGFACFHKDREEQHQLQRQARTVLAGDHPD